MRTHVPCGPWRFHLLTPLAVAPCLAAMRAGPPPPGGPTPCPRPGVLAQGDTPVQPTIPSKGLNVSSSPIRDPGQSKGRSRCLDAPGAPAHPQ